ncbi:MAG TPA: FecR domain-containing protein [Cyclobacteriaceae bacterium]
MSIRSHQSIDPELLVRFLSEEVTEQERQQVNQWISADKLNHIHFEEFFTIWNAGREAGEFKNDFLIADWKKIQDKIAVTEIEVVVTSPSKNRSLFFNLARIAATLLILAASYVIAEKIYHRYSTTEMQVANGSEHTTIHLPDGSIVTMNSNSKITHPRRFTGKTREITLQGEAFFEIAEDKQKPFIIKTGEVLTKVVGTSFSVNTNSNQVVVTVLTGKVLLYKDSTEVIAMTKGQQGLYTINGLEKRNNADINFLSWKTKVLTFDNTPLTEVIEDINRHFHVSIQLTPNSLEGCTLTSTFKNQSLEEIMKELKIIFNVQVERRADGITITGKGCK